MGGSDSNTTTTQKFEPPSYTQGGQGWEGYIDQARNLASAPRTQYQGMTVAPLNDLQNTGLQFITDRALNGAPDLNSARQQATATTQGQYLGQGPQASAGHNPFAGSNTYLNDMIGRNADNMTRAAQLGPMAQTDAMAARGGAFGGSAYAQLQGQNTAALAKSVGDMATQNRFQDYTAQQGLAESGLNRNMQAQQANMGAYDAERNRMLSAGGLAGQLSQDDWQAGKSLTGAGDAYGAYTQKLLDSAKGEFDQTQAYPWQNLENFGSALSRASGTYGGGGTQTGSQQLPGMSPLAGLLGVGTGVYGVSQFFK